MRQVVQPRLDGDRRPAFRDIEVISRIDMIGVPDPGSGPLLLRGGVRLPDAVVGRIVGARAAGQSLPRIAAALEADGVPTGRGGTRWYPSTIKAVCESMAGQRLTG